MFRELILAAIRSFGVIRLTLCPKDIKIALNWMRRRIVLRQSFGDKLVDIRKIIKQYKDNDKKRIKKLVLFFVF